MRITPNKEGRKDSNSKTQILYSWFPGFIIKRFLILTPVSFYNAMVTV